MNSIGLPAFAVHPGEILEEEFRKPLGLTQTELAKRLKTTYQTVNAICRQRRAISAKMALRLGKVFGTSAEFWLGMQNLYDLVKAKKQEEQTLKKIRPIQIQTDNNGVALASRSRKTKNKSA